MHLFGRGRFDDYPFPASAVSRLDNELVSKRYRNKTILGSSFLGVYGLPNLRASLRRKSPISKMFFSILFFFSGLDASIP
jgi:hypothetical protein